ncbi:MAG: hemerythrin domain-containing protein [Pirellulaceae bacterium]|jgi:hemerythrin-like domain-containing protein|nr:hemerythrin domain-containing protein [Pirellulaceae bacterium]
MKPTDVLKSEHRVIEQVLDCLAAIVRRGEATGRLDGTMTREALEFFRHFADHCHHGKEEAHLFPALEARGFSREQGPTGVMLDEHETGRAHVRAMESQVDGAASGDAAALADFVRQAQGFIGLLRQHIDKEDHCLFAMADQAFSAAEQQELLEAFHAVEQQHAAADTHARYLALADRLAAQLGVERRPE